MNQTSLYIHVPFCRQRCGYCDFNTYAGIQELIPEYTAGVCNEIVYLGKTSPSTLFIGTIYFGGGTPSLLSAQQLGAILHSITQEFRLYPGAEISIEANPGTVTPAYLEEISGVGINRVSLGMQSADRGELRMLERQHTFEEVVQAVEWCRAAGINNINLDLIFGLPGQSLKTWMESVEDAIDLNPTHLSLYALTLEHGTLMKQEVEAGKLPEPDPDVAADMYEAASERLADAGFIQYEISNWSAIDEEGELYSCKHNLQYWRNLAYLGVGAGAHGYIDHCRTIDVLTPRAYIQRLGEGSTPALAGKFPRTPATIECNAIDRQAEIGETMMMGLRLVGEGVSNRAFQERFGISLEEQFSQQINQLTGYGLLEWAGDAKDILRLTKRGYLLGNQVFKEFI
jgi:oxygen-independent coproporphyrinogen III oxidase